MAVSTYDKADHALMEAVFKRDVGLRFLTVRTALGVAQDKMLGITGSTQQAVSKWENGTNLVPPYEAILICERFGLTASWLYEGKTLAEVDGRLMRRLYEAERHLRSIGKDIP